MPRFLVSLERHQTLDVEIEAADEEAAMDEAEDLACEGRYDDDWNFSHLEAYDAAPVNED